MSLTPPPGEVPSPATAAAHGVEPGFDEFFRAHVGSMVRLGRLITGSAAVGEEIAQDAFAAAYRQWSDLREPAAFVRTAVVYRSRSYLRRQDVSKRAADRRPSVEPSTVDSYGDAALRSALAGLNDRQRAAVVLKYWADLPEKEIARLLDCRPGTVKSMLSRAIDELRKVVTK
jgi:RNA polymerase sigma-70 factor (sigma-E family)